MARNVTGRNYHSRVFFSAACGFLRGDKREEEEEEEKEEKEAEGYA